ncbi:MAG TPA: hypothetical protein VF746_03550 [Longimicrobium sp.]|jgi:hypothetical protein
MTQTTLVAAPPVELKLELKPAAARILDAEMELTDDELEAVVGGLARVHFPAAAFDTVAAG